MQLSRADFMSVAGSPEACGVSYQCVKVSAMPLGDCRRAGGPILAGLGQA